MASETSRTSLTENRLSEVLDSTRYRPNIQARNIIIQRSTATFGAPGVSKQVSKRESSYGGYNTSVDTSGYVALSSTGVTSVKDSREREKKDLQGLNERLANYIERVRFYEAQNRKLADELEKLKAMWGKETQRIKDMYQAELDEARRLLDEVVKDKSHLEIRLASLEDLLEELRQRLQDALRDEKAAIEKFEHQNQQLSDMEGEVALMRRRMASLEAERDKERAQNKKLQEALNLARADLDKETMLHIDAENRRQTLEEELEFLKALHEQELKELQALAYRDSTAENREYWKTEMGQALREIQDAYDDKMDVLRGELDTHYNLKLQQVQTGAAQNNVQNTHFKEESVRLRDQMKILRDKLAESENRNAQLARDLEELRREKEERERELEHSNFELTARVAQLQAEMEAMLREIQVIVDAKHMLELEIHTYRRLLEGEEKRTGLSKIVGSIVSSDGALEFGNSQTEHSSRISSGEMSAKTTYQKSAKGPISVFETSPDGKYIGLENTGRKEEGLGGWSLSRNIDGKESATYRLSDSFALGAGQKIKVWSKGTKPFPGTASDIESDQNWGIGGHIITRLINQVGEERATHIQQTKYN